MTPLHFHADNGRVFVTSGARSAYVTQDQADQYAVLFFTHRLVRQANELTDAMVAAGYVPWGRRAAA